jgi:hypothetical protein
MADPTPPTPAPDRPTRGPSPTGRRWAEQELGELLARAWLEGDGSAEAPSANADPPPATAGLWEVAAVPSAAEGGIVAMLLGDPADAPPSGDAAAVDAPPADPASFPEPAGDPGGPDRARLHEMLHTLPAEPAPRLTPDDVDVDTPDPAPPAVWFWGDDDIYPARTAGPADPRPVRSWPRRR